LKLSNILCLGDSYTIAEGVALHQNFPYQLIQLLRKKNKHFAAPEIVAKTGWTSFELLEHLQHTQLESNYNFVTLLVGVNNQYRGLSTTNFAIDFEILLQKALHFVDNKSKNVIVISIPDWGVTPFAADRNEQQITNEINAFNGICELMAQKYQTHFIDITAGTRLAKNDNTLLTTDLLHYSQKEYANWANKIEAIINN
jgi:lysophospholipase L1-like esterase